MGAHSESCTHVYCAANKSTRYRWPLPGASSRTGLCGGICQCCTRVRCGLMRRSFCTCRTPEKSSLHGPYHLGLIHRLHFRVDSAFLVCVGKDCPCALFVLTFFCLSDKKTLLDLCKWDVCLTVYPVKHTIKIQWLYSLILYNFSTLHLLPFHVREAFTSETHPYPHQPIGLAKGTLCSMDILI